MTINNNITESYCGFEVSKLLKEKGFDVPCKRYYDLNGDAYTTRYYDIQSSDTIFKPSHTLAIEWIRQNFDIEIEVRIMKGSDIKGNRAKGKEKMYEAWVFNLHDDNWSYGETQMIDFNSPQEATEAALKYCLTEIKL